MLLRFAMILIASFCLTGIAQAQADVDFEDNMWQVKHIDNACLLRFKYTVGDTLGMIYFDKKNATETLLLYNPGWTDFKIGETYRLHVFDEFDGTGYSGRDVDMLASELNGKLMLAALTKDSYFIDLFTYDSIEFSDRTPPFKPEGMLFEYQNRQIGLFHFNPAFQDARSALMICLGR